LGIRFSVTGLAPVLFAYADARLGTQPGIASVFFLGKDSGAFHADCHSTTRAVGSTVEVELHGVNECAKTCIHFRNMLSEIGYPQLQPTTIYCDNLSTIHWVGTNAYHELSRHFEPDFYMLREWKARGLIDVKKIPTVDNVADILTKPLAKSQFEYLRNMLLNGPGATAI
jgi:hypothetical protein